MKLDKYISTLCPHVDEVLIPLQTRHSSSTIHNSTILTKKKRITYEVEHIDKCVKFQRLSECCVQIVDCNAHLELFYTFITLNTTNNQLYILCLSFPIQTRTNFITFNKLQCKSHNSISTHLYLHELITIRAKHRNE